MRLLVIASVALLIVCFAKQTVAQVRPDSSLAPTASLPAADSSALPTPNSALWRSLALPGFGQVYVGQSYKAPFVIGALGGLVGLSLYLNGRYTRYRQAYLYVVNEEMPDPTTPNPENPNVEFFADWIESGAGSASATRQQRDNNRRNRDLALLGTGLVYALQALDAYVAAHLADFDVSEDLTLQIGPSSEGPRFVAILQF